MVAVFPDATSPTILLAQCLKVILGFQTLWPSVLSHINFDLKKLLPGQQEMNFPPILQQLTLQILLQAPAGSLKWHQQVSYNHSVEYTVPPKASKVIHLWRSDKWILMIIPFCDKLIYVP